MFVHLKELVVDYCFLMNLVENLTAKFSG